MNFRDIFSFHLVYIKHHHPKYDFFSSEFRKKQWTIIWEIYLSPELGFGLARKNYPDLQVIIL